ncbi:MAG TPA: outer membrane protein transport protein [Cytophagaceae bacterium]
MRKNLLIFFLLISAIGVKAGGYQVNLVGIRYVGMGHIGTALSIDAGSIFFNPGALSLIEPKYSFTGGVSGIISKTTFRAQGTIYEAHTESGITPPFQAFGSAKVAEKFAIGLGVYTPFGSSVEWDNNWAGKFLIQDISLKSIFFQPTASYKITDRLGIGAGLVFAYGKVDLKRALPVTSISGEDGSVRLKGHTFGWGFNAGVNYKPTDNLKLGLSYRSKVTMDLNGGDATFNVPASLSSNFPNTQFDVSLPLPATLSFGIAYDFSEKLLVGIDVNYVFWDAYDSLIFDFEQNTSSLDDSRNPRLYDNSIIVRLGAQYKASDKFYIRGGVYFDESPVQDQFLNPETPDANRIGLSAGLSFFPTERLSIDASFLFTRTSEREGSYSPANFSGIYQTNAYIPGLGLTYNF